MVMTRTSPVITRGSSESARKTRIRLRNEIKEMQQQSASEHVKENKFSNQPTRTTINRNYPEVPTKKLYVVPDENSMFNVPNLVKQINQPKPRL